MKHLIIVRHGDYGTDRRLSENGKNQITGISLRLVDLNPGKDCVILTSIAPRALDSADIIQEKFGITNYVKVPFFWSDNTAPSPTYYRDRNPSKVMDIICEYEDIDIVIVVSHLELVNEFPSFFAETQLGKNWNLPELEKGQAIHIDITEKSFRILKRITNSLLECKLKLLHNLLVITNPRPTLPDELTDYKKDYETFKAETEGLSDPFDSKYITALSKFRDVLIKPQ